MKNICVYCGASKGNGDVYLEKAAELGRLLAEKNIGLVYGGGSVGLMGMIAESCLKNGGRVTGVITEHLLDMEVAHNGLTELVVTKDMHERKAKMQDLSDGFISMPGGVGTLEETFEIFTWLQLGIHEKPLGILNTADFYKNLWIFMEHVVSENFLRKEHLDMILFDSDPEKLLEGLISFKPLKLAKWFNKEDAMITE